MLREFYLDHTGMFCFTEISDVREISGATSGMEFWSDGLRCLQPQTSVIEHHEVEEKSSTRKRKIIKPSQR
jgi:hypothetical protein